MSRAADAAVGMMDTAYFVGRGELLDFFNNLLGLQLTKIEQTASGAVACQLTEYIFPRSIPMSRVNWEARSDYEFVANYKLLQAAFTKNRVQRHVDVDKLIRAKYQDNLEFCQWLKAFYDQSGVVRDDYDATAVRGRGKGGARYNDFLNKTASKHGSKPLPAARRTRPTAPAVSPAKPSTRTTAAAAAARSTAPPARGSPRRAISPKKPVSARTDSSTVENAALTKKNVELVQTNAELTQSNAELTQSNADLVQTNAELIEKADENEKAMIELEKERDFYFGKLRDIEFMLQIKQENEWKGETLTTVVDNIFKVLYATATDEIKVTDDGNILLPGEEENGSVPATDVVDVADANEIKPVVSDPMDEQPEENGLSHLVNDDDDDALFAEEY